jgi:hypothetical protein
LHVVVRAEEVGTGAVVNRVLDVDRRRQVYVAGADEVDSMHIHVRNADG